MRFVSYKVSIKLPAFLFVLFLLAAGSFSPASGQTAPYILPYTMSTYAGPTPSTVAGVAPNQTPPVVGVACGSGNYVSLAPSVTPTNYVALDTTGDGCLAPYIEVSSDPHDLRVDGKGNVLYVDNVGKAVIHKISGLTGLDTAYVGSVAGKVCSAGDKFGGDGCVATDGAANSAGGYTGGFSTLRGMAVAPNGDVFTANYSQNIFNKVPAAPAAVSPAAEAGIMVPVGGDGTSGYFNGAVGTSQVSSPRGVGVDPNTGTVYLADTGNDVVRKSVLSGGAYTLSDLTLSGATTGQGSAGCVGTYAKNVANGPVATSVVCAPEDVQVDLNGNVFIADAGNNVVRAVYNGKGTLPGVSSPQTGTIYLIAGYSSTNNIGATTLTPAYPTDGTTPAFPATSIPMNVRKIALDTLGNLYIPDDGATANSVWFVDHTTGYARLLAGSYGLTAPAAAPGATRGCTGITPFVQTDNLGDGCPAQYAGMLTSVNSNPGGAPDNQGNLYLSDSEGKSATASLIRKVLSGLNFPAEPVGTAATAQVLFVHFAPGDKAATAAPFISSGSDFVIGTPNCPAANNDNTSDCYVPVTFKPSKPGHDTATLTITSALGGVNSYLLSGTGTAPTIAIDPGSTAVVTTPSPTNNAQGMVLDGVGNAFIADTGNNRILLYTVSTGTTTVFAGTGSSGYSGDNGLASAAKLNGPRAVTIGTDGNLYIADTGNNVIRKVNVIISSANVPVAGNISTYAGGATTVCVQATNTRGDGCPGTQAIFSAPSGITFDTLGNLYISDTGNNVIRQISVQGWVFPLAGGASAVCAGSSDTYGDNCSAAASIFSSPQGLVYDPVGKFLIVADTGHNEVRRIYLSNTFSYGGSGTTTTAATVLINGVQNFAGNGQAGSSIGANNVATNSQLSAPIGVAVDSAENVYIADSNNDAVRLVNAANGTISTIMGINGSAGTGTVPGPASGAQLNLPAGVAVSPTGLLYVIDSGNNRILTDSRSQITFNFGRINQNSSSPVQTFTELNIGTSTAKLSTDSSTPLLVASGSAATNFTLTAPNTGGCVNGQSLTVGASCILQGQFNVATAIGNFSETYTETTATSVGASPSITLTGIGAMLTPTNSSVAQTVPATGNSQYGGSVTVTATVTATCNTAAPSCYPSGTLRIIVDGTAGSPLTLSSTATASQAQPGLSVGPHVISCSYSGDNYYAASTCPNVTITVAQASTTSLLSVSNNNQPQFTSTTFTATVISNTSGIPTGTVTFFANGTSIGTGSVDPNSGIASVTLSIGLDSNGNIATNTTLPPGTYSMTCTYNGSANFAVSNCPATSFVVAPATTGFNTMTVITQVGTTTVKWQGTLLVLPCPLPDLYAAGTSTPGYGIACTSGVTYVPVTGTIPTVGTADGSTTDATIFVSPSNTMSGTLTFACSGLPATTTCTFSPTSIKLTPGTGYVNPLAVDVTLWTDLQSTAGLRTPAIGSGKTAGIYAARIGWPMALLGLATLLFFRRKNVMNKGLSLLGLLLIMAGMSLTVSGCAGPGAYTPALTPAGTYPITITVTDNPGGISTSAVVNFKVASPGITGQQ